MKRVFSTWSLAIFLLQHVLTIVSSNKRENGIQHQLNTNYIRLKLIMDWAKLDEKKDTKEERVKYHIVYALAQHMTPATMQ